MSIFQGLEQVFMTFKFCNRRTGISVYVDAHAKLIVVDTANALGVALGDAPTL